MYGYLGTRLNSEVTSATYPLAIEGIKDGDGQSNLASRLVKLEGDNGGKEKGMAPEEHTTAPAHLACLYVDAWCDAGQRQRARMCDTSVAVPLAFPRTHPLCVLLAPRLVPSCLGRSIDSPP